MHELDTEGELAAPARRVREADLLYRSGQLVNKLNNHLISELLLLHVAGVPLVAHQQLGSNP